MACAVTALSSTSNCTSVGGIVKAYMTEASNVTAITVAGGVATGLTMSGVGLWSVFNFNKTNDSAFYNQTGNRQGQRLVYDHTGLMSFSKVDNTKVNAARSIGQCCELAAIIIFASGYRALAGFDYDVDADTFLVMKQPLRITPSVLSDTGAGEDRVDYNFVGQSIYPQLDTDLTDTAIEAL